MGKPADFSRGVGGPQSPWNISTLQAAWEYHAAIVENDPNDLEQWYASGLALQMAGEEGCDSEYIRFCKAAEAYHITVDEAVKYYSGIIKDMEAAGENASSNTELFNLKGRIKLLQRYEKMRKEDRSWRRKYGCSIS
jgi:hypothetical protein